VLLPSRLFSSWGMSKTASALETAEEPSYVSLAKLFASVNLPVRPSEVLSPSSPPACVAGSLPWQGRGASLLAGLCPVG
jgi:hypothetical protein